jgi:hypothetical protein
MIGQPRRQLTAAEVQTRPPSLIKEEKNSMTKIPPFMPKAPRKKIAQRQIELRNRLWPTHHDGHLWRRQAHDGFMTLPRTMPLMLEIMNDLAGGQPVSTTYLELWGRAYDESFVTLSKPREMAFHAGFAGQRGERTWRGRMKLLAQLGFINIKEGPSGPMSYALILNPYLVIRRHMQEGHPGVRADKYNALMQRAGEIGASDLDMPDPWTTPATSPADLAPVPSTAPAPV